MSDFEVKDAAKEAQSVSIGLFGPSGCGKTLSALRIAKGIQSVVGGRMYVIDTEARRALDYSDDFEFKHVDFKPPFGADRYLKAIEACIADGTPGPRTVIVDSLSHEHESEGGMLEQFEEELKRFGGGEKNNARAWIRPKALRRKLIVRMDQMRDVNFILTFRAADKTKPGKDADGKSTYVHMGFIPIGGQDFVFGTKATAFLPPGADGVPMWNPEFVGEKLMRKLPMYLKGILADGKPLSEDHGRKIAEWASRGAKAQPPRVTTNESPIVERAVAMKEAMRKATSVAQLKKFYNGEKGLEIRTKLDDLNAVETIKDLTLTFDSRLQELEEKAVEAVK